MLGSLPATIYRRFLQIRILQIRFLHQRDRYLRDKRDFESAMRLDSHVQFVQISRLEVHGATQFTLLLSYSYSCYSSGRGVVTHQLGVVFANGAKSIKHDGRCIEGGRPMGDIGWNEKHRSG